MAYSHLIRFVSKDLKFCIHLIKVIRPSIYVMLLLPRVSADILPGRGEDPIGLVQIVFDQAISLNSIERAGLDKDRGRTREIRTYRQERRAAS